MKKILLSLSMIAIIAAVAAGATGAFFSDTETSTGNTFTAGAIDLKIDSEATYNDQPVPAATWELKDLIPTSDKFFNFNDIKPGDSGENTISLHILNNDAWVCAEVFGLTSLDNGETEPESLVDNSDPDTEGELDNEMLWTIWKDDGDNIMNGDEVALLSGQPVNGVLALYDSTTGTPLSGGSTGYLGVSWSLPGESGNETQTDSLTGNISFSVVQSRNNADFVCSGGEEEHGWIEKNPNAEFGVRMGHNSLVKDGKVWVLGGLGTSGAMNDIWSSNSNDGVNWTETSTSGPLWTPRAMASGLVYDGKMWIMGGFDSSFDSLNDVWSSPDGINWTEVTNEAGWSLRHGASAVVYDDKMWVMGGGTPNSSFTTLSDVWSSSDGVNWTYESNAPWTPRRYSSLVNFQGKMFLIGGLDASNGDLNDVWSSTDGINWTQEVADAPWEGKGGHQAVVYNNKIWIMGGEISHYPTVNTEHFNDVWSSPDGINWTQESDALWEAREFFSAVVANSKIWVTAGGQNVPTFGDVWQYSD